MTEHDTDTNGSSSGCLKTALVVCAIWVSVGLFLTFSIDWPKDTKMWVFGVIWSPVILIGGDLVFEGWKALPFMRAWRESLPKPSSGLGFDEERIVYALFEAIAPIAFVFLVLWLVHGFTGWPQL